MTKRNTYIVTAIVVACVVIGVVVYANWDNLRTAIGLGGEFNTGWVELRDGTTVAGTTYQVTQNPADPDTEPVLMPAYAPFNGKISRWDVGEGSWADREGPIVMSLGNDFPTGSFNVKMKLKYAGSQPTQAEPLLIETLDAAGALKSTMTIRDGESNCNRDNTDWVDVDSNCSSGGGTPLKLEFVKNGKIRFTATQGSLNIGGIEISGQTGLQGPNVDIPKTADKSQIQPTEDMKFTFTIKNLTAQTATKVFLYETFMDGNLDGMINMDTSTISTPGGTPVTLSSLGTCAGTPEAGGYCFMDLGGAAGVPDTLVAYLPTLNASASIPINLTFKPKVAGFEAKTYTNYVGITSQEMNASNTSFPSAILEEIAHTNPKPWTWKTSSAPVKVIGGVTPPGALLLDKTPATQTVAQGAAAIFEVKMGNSTAVPQSQVFFWDTWADDPSNPNSNKNLDQQVDSVWINIPGSTSDYVQLTGAKPDYSNCGGTAELAACYIDIDADGAGDTILMYTNQALGQFPLTKMFDLKFNFKSTAALETYTNHVGVTSKEMNPNDPAYPNDFLVSQWNWILKSATVRVQAGPVVSPTPTPTPTQQPHAKLQKTVAKAGVVQPGSATTVKPGDTVEYTIQLTNDGNQDLHNMKVIDNYDTTHLENIAITQGAQCPTVTNDQVCFSLGTVSASSPSAVPVLKYTAKVKSTAPQNTEVNNNANCISDEFPVTGGGGIAEACHASAMFKVNQEILPVSGYELWVNKEVDKASAKVGDKLTYTTTAGNKGKSSANHVWMIDSLLFAENGQVVLSQLQQAFGTLSLSANVLEVQGALQKGLGITDSAASAVTDNTSRVFKNKLGDDATTGLEISSTGPAQEILDLDRDGIKDTIIHLKDATWDGTSGGVQAPHTQKPYTGVRKDLAPGDHKIINTGLVVKFKDTGAPEIYNDPADTLVKVPGVLEQNPVIGVTKTVSDTDETNKTSNTAVAGEAMSYTVTYTNTGAGMARGAFIEDDYDERYIKITDAAGSQDSGSALMWSLGNVAAGQTVSKTFKVAINSNLAEVGATFKNVGIVGAQGQPNKSAETTTTVPVKTSPSDQPYLVDSKIVVNENGGAVQPGDTLRYTVTIENKGKAAATNVSADDTLPSSLENLKIVSIPTGAKDETSGNKIKISGFTVNAGASVQIVYTAQVKAGVANGTKITNDVVVLYGTTGGRATGVATGRVGSAFTGPNTGSAEANLIEAGVAKAAETGANSLTTALVVIGLAIATGITAVVLRKRSLVS